jgi:2,3-bisphosphoglycerate-dependent phosphoglycerate mutase
MAQSQQRPIPKDRRRRRRRRAASVVLFSITTLGLAWFFESQATTTILFVRHADTDAAMGSGRDPPLNARGRARAELLADFLEDVDVIAGVDAIYASEFRRTQETAAPLASRLGIQVAIADPYDVIGFMRSVLRRHKGDIVLVVSHSDTIAPLVEELHGSKNLPDFGPDDFDDLYVVTIPNFGKVKTLRLPYAVGWQPPHDGEPRFSE